MATIQGPYASATCLVNPPGVAAKVDSSLYIPPPGVSTFGFPQPGHNDWIRNIQSHIAMSAATQPAAQAATLQVPPDHLGPPVTLMVDACGIRAASKKHKCVLLEVESHLYTDIKSATIEDIISDDMSLMESLLGLGLPVLWLKWIKVKMMTLRLSQIRITQLLRLLPAGK